MTQESACPIPSGYKEMIVTAKEFVLNPWILALVILAVVSLMAWMILKPEKRPRD